MSLQIKICFVFFKYMEGDDVSFESYIFLMLNGHFLVIARKVPVLNNTLSYCFSFFVFWEKKYRSTNQFGTSPPLLHLMTNHRSIC